MTHWYVGPRPINTQQHAPVRANHVTPLIGLLAPTVGSLSPMDDGCMLKHGKFRPARDGEYTKGLSKLSLLLRPRKVALRGGGSTMEIRQPSMAEYGSASFECLPVTLTRSLCISAETALLSTIQLLLMTLVSGRLTEGSVYFMDWPAATVMNAVPGSTLNSADTWSARIFLGKCLPLLSSSPTSLCQMI